MEPGVACWLVEGRTATPSWPAPSDTPPRPASTTRLAVTLWLPALFCATQVYSPWSPSRASCIEQSC